MASFTNQQQQQRELYKITRSEAIELVNMYTFSQEKIEDGGIEPLRVFRDQLETTHGAYLGKYNNSREGKFYKIACVLYNVISELSRRVDESDHDYKISLMVKLFPCSKFIAEETATYLNWAVYNWYFSSSKPLQEELDDNCFETNNCCVCGFEGDDVFYFSTVYGLNNPVCDICVRSSNEENESDDLIADADYVVVEEEEADEEYEEDEEDEEEEEEEEEEDQDEEDEEEEENPSCFHKEYEMTPRTCAVCNYYGTGYFYNYDCCVYYSSKAVYTWGPVCIDCHPSEGGDEEVKQQETKEEESDNDDADYVPSEDEEEDEEAEDEEDEAEEDELIFGCTGCNYEWRDGWVHGYKTALKKMRQTINELKEDIPNAPRCANCDDSHADLKKCGRCKKVRYCSIECQTEDWKHRHKKSCCKH